MIGHTTVLGQSLIRTLPVNIVSGLKNELIIRVLNFSIKYKYIKFIYRVWPILECGS